MALDARVFASGPGTYSTRPLNVVYLVLATTPREDLNGAAGLMTVISEHLFKSDAEKAVLEYKSDGIAYVVEARRK